MTNLSKNAVTVLERRYLARNEASELIETPEGMFRRVANAIAEGDKNYDPNADVAALLSLIHFVCQAACHPAQSNGPGSAY